MFVCINENFCATGNTAVEAFDKLVAYISRECGDDIKMSDCQFVAGSESRAKLTLEPIKKAVSKTAIKKPVAKK